MNGGPCRVCSQVLEFYLLLALLFLAFPTRPSQRYLQWIFTPRSLLCSFIYNFKKEKLMGCGRNYLIAIGGIGLMICPVAAAIIAIGNSAVVIGLWPAHFLWTYYCIAKWVSLFSINFCCIVCILSAAVLLWIEANELVGFWRFLYCFHCLSLWFCGLSWALSEASSVG